MKPETCRLGEERPGHIPVSYTHLARLKAMLGIVIAALVCTGLFFVMFWGVVPVKSTDASIEYSAWTYINNGKFFRSIEFEYALREGKVLNTRCLLYTSRCV